MALAGLSKVVLLDPATGEPKPVHGLRKRQCGTFTIARGVIKKTFPDFEYSADFMANGVRFRSVLCCESDFAHQMTFDRSGGGWHNPALEHACAKLEEYRRNAKTGGGPTRREQERRQALAERRETEERAAALAEAERNRPTINRLWELYTEARPDIKGLAQDRNRFDNYLRPTLGDKLPAEITPIDLDRLRLGLLRGKIGPAKEIKEGNKVKKVVKAKSPQTANHALVLLRRLIRFGVEKGHCPPTGPKIKIPKVDNEVTEHLTDAQLTAFLAALDSDPDHLAVAAFKLVLFTGMRRGELLGLRWTNVDLDRALVRLDNPKGGKSITLPISASAVDLLRDVAAMKKAAIEAAEAPDLAIKKKRERKAIERQARRFQTDLVFPGEEGTRRHDLKRPVERIRKAAGLPAGFRPFHGLRHHFASTLASSGEVDLYTLQKLLTHKDPATTQRYAHLRDETLRSAADVAARAVTQAAQKKELAEGQ